MPRSRRFPATAANSGAGGARSQRQSLDAASRPHSTGSHATRWIVANFADRPPYREIRGGREREQVAKAPEQHGEVSASGCRRDLDPKRRFVFISSWR